MSPEDLENELATLLERAVEEDDRQELEKLLEQINRLLKAREAGKTAPSE